MTTLRDIITAAAKHRPTLPRAIGCADAGVLRDVDGVPDAIASVYEVAEGTPRQIEDQRVMDIVPGYRLIHKAELAAEITTFRAAYPDLTTHYPFLADYSSSYFTVDSIDGVVHTVDRECGVEPISRSLGRFLDTILACYAQEIYFLDADGYLEYDADKEGDVGAALNPEYPYWTEGEPPNRALNARA
jgi:hypothetical protein